MTKWILLVVGLLLLVSGAWGWYRLSLRPTAEEAWWAQQPEIQIPVTQLAEKPELNFITPRGPALPRSVARTWGEPILMFAAVSETQQMQYCLDGLEATVLSGPAMRDLGRSGAIYGYTAAYSASCQSIGWRFPLSQGETASIRLGGTVSGAPSDAELVFLQTWPNMKDKLVGLDIDADLRTVAKWAMGGGLLALLVSTVVFVCSNGETTAPVETAP